jgi:hypothetical protein
MVNCQPNTDVNGDKLPWGNFPWDSLYGKNGWCDAEVPSMQ